MNRQSEPEILASGGNCSCFVLRRLSRTVSRLYDQHLAALDLKTTQFSLLSMLAGEPMTVTGLARMLGVDRTSLSRNIKPLLARGLIDSKTGADARQHVLCLSGAGRTTLRQARRAWRAAQAELIHTLGPRFVDELHGQIEFAQRRLDPLSKRAQ